MRKWLTNNFLPMWAKETVLAENKKLKKENAKLKHEVDNLLAYICGMEFALKEGCGQCLTQEKSWL